jgi:hypothetical protein
MQLLRSQCELCHRPWLPLRSRFVQPRLRQLRALRWLRQRPRLSLWCRRLLSSLWRLRQRPRTLSLHLSLSRSRCVLRPRQSPRRGLNQPCLISSHH